MANENLFPATEKTAKEMLSALRGEETESTPANARNLTPFTEKTAREILAEMRSAKKNSLGITGAKPGQIAVVKEVDEDGAPTAWSAYSDPLKRYGFRVKQSEANYNDRVEYLFDAAGIEPAFMDFSAGKFNYGGWADMWFVKKNLPCMVKRDGTVDYILHPTDYSKKLDGSPSDVANADYDGNAMASMPTVWVKRYTENGYRYCIFCEEQYDETYHAYAHTRPDGSIAPFLYGPMFKGSMIDGYLRSISGQRPQSNANATAEKTAAQKNGDRWGIRTWMFDELIADLLVLISKSTGCQERFGRGHESGGSSADDFLNTGTLNDKGQFYGYSASDKQVKVFHMEGFWAERWDRTDGILLINNRFFVKPTPENGGYNFVGTGYTDTGIDAAPSEGYVKEFTATEYGSVATLTGGSSTTFECDYFYKNASGTRVPIRGGACNAGAACGRYLNCFPGAGNAWWYLGASPYLVNPS